MEFFLITSIEPKTANRVAIRLAHEFASLESACRHAILPEKVSTKTPGHPNVDRATIDEKRFSWNVQLVVDTTLVSA